VIGQIIRALIRIRNYERIPKLPRGMLASKYQAIDHDESRVLARMGARDPRGVRVAMRRAGVEDVDLLVAGMDHHKARRRVRRRISSMIGRWLRATDYHPHQSEILKDQRESKLAVNVEVQRRMRHAKTKMTG